MSVYLILILYILIYVNCDEPYIIKYNVIIRTEDSIRLGAIYINETHTANNHQCLLWCQQHPNCNTAVYEEKKEGSCYLFDCGSPNQIKCRFTDHEHYTSSLILTKDQNKYYSKHENDLVNLRISTPSRIETTVLPTTGGSLLAPQSSIPLILTSTLTPKENTNCQRYQFQCRNTSDCIAIYNVCDGIAQCSDASDEASELHCPDTSYTSAETHPSQPKLGSKYQTKVTDVRIVNPYNFPKSPDLPKSMSYDRKYIDFVPGNQYEKNIFQIGTDGAIGMGSESGSSNIITSNRATNNLPLANSPASNIASNVPIGPRYDSHQYYHDFRRYPDDYMNNFAGNNGNGNGNDIAFWPEQYNRPNHGLQAIVKMFQGSLSSNPSQSLRYPFIYKRPDDFSPDSVGKFANNEMESTLNQNNELQTEHPKIKSSLSNDLKQQKFHQSTTKSFSHLERNVPTIKTPVAISHLSGSDTTDGRDTNSAVIALILGVCITAMLVGIVVCRMKYIERRITRRGRNLAHDADYLVNGMYL